MKRLWIPVIALLAAQMALATAWGAEQPARRRAGEAAPVSTRVERVALFKNGLGFFVRRGALPERAGPLVIEPLPAPVHGTFWVSYGAGVGLRDLVAKEAVRHERLPAISISEMLRANVGKKVVAWMADDEKSAITGTIVSFAADRKPFRVDPYAAGPAPVADTRYYGGYPGPLGGRLVLIKTDRGVTAIDPNAVRRLEIPGDDAASDFDQEQPAAALHATLAKPARDRALTVSYLTKGITWAPSYLVDISDPKTARISAKAMIMNEVEDLNGVNVDLVTGFPNIMFSEVTSPIALKQRLSDFLAALGGRTETQRRGDVMSNVMYQSEPAGAYGEASPHPAMPSYAAAAPGWQAEDLFLYPLEKVTLAKGEVGYYPLFTESVPYRHVYQWEIPDYVTQEDRYGEQRREERDKPEEVWHCLRLKNATKVPWTTAPAQTVQKNQILGQDILRYANPGSEALLRITQAMGVKAEQREVEVERAQDALRMFGYSFDRITIRGDLRVQNYKTEAISLEIAKTLSGELKSATPEPEVAKLARGLQRVSPTSLLKWTLELPGGEAKDLTYTYTVLVRR